MSLKDDKQQNIQMGTGLLFCADGCSPKVSQEKRLESLMATNGSESPARTNRLMEEVCERENLKEALRQVKVIKVAREWNGITVNELTDYLKQHWASDPRTTAEWELTEPKPVRRVEIPKPDGGVRKLAASRRCWIGDSSSKR